MLRTITMPADLATTALDDLKGWLGITRPNEDALLADCLSASLALCEAFIGQMPIEQEIGEGFAPVAGWQCLTSRPVRALVSANSVAPDGTTAPIEPASFDFRINATGVGAIRFPACPQVAPPLSPCAPGLRRTGAQCPPHFARALSGSPLSIIATAKRAAMQPRLPASPHFGAHGACCASYDPRWHESSDGRSCPPPNIESGSPRAIARPRICRATPPIPPPLAVRC